MKAVFWLGLMFLMQISSLCFNQESLCSSLIYVLYRLINFLVILSIFGDK